MWAERMSAKRWIWEELRIAAVLQSTGNISTNSTSSVLVGLLLFSLFSLSATMAGTSRVCVGSRQPQH